MPLRINEQKGAMPHRTFHTTQLKPESYSFSATDTDFTITAQTHQQSLTAPIDQVFTYLQPAMPIGLLPPALRWMSPDLRHVLLERPPRRVLIDWDTHHGGSGGGRAHIKHHQHHLWLPWTLTGISFAANFSTVEQLCVFAQNAPLTSLTKEPLGWLPLPNMLDGGNVCAAREFDNDYNRQRERSEVTWAALLGHVANHTWTTAFNNSAGLGPYLAVPQLGPAYTEWNTFLSGWAELPLERVLTIAWPPVYKNAQQWISRTLEAAKFQQSAATLKQATLLAARRQQRKTPR